MLQVASDWIFKPTELPNWAAIIIVAILLFIAVSMYNLGESRGRQEMLDELVEREERRRHKLKNAGRWTDQL